MLVIPFRPLMAPPLRRDPLPHARQSHRWCKHIHTYAYAHGLVKERYCSMKLASRLHPTLLSQAPLQGQLLCPRAQLSFRVALLSAYPASVWSGNA